MHNVKHTEEAKKKMSETKKKNYALKPISSEWKEKIRQTNKANYAAMKRAYMITEYGIEFLEKNYGIEYMIQEYGTDYRIKYANMK
jgi:hypothetical protein